MHVEDYCFCTDFCKNYGEGCSLCFFSPTSRVPNPINNFLSTKCGLTSDLCFYRRDIDTCYSCEPFDLLCCHFRADDYEV